MNDIKTVTVFRAGSTEPIRLDFALELPTFNGREGFLELCRWQAEKIHAVLYDSVSGDVYDALKALMTADE